MKKVKIGICVLLMLTILGSGILTFLNIGDDAASNWQEQFDLGVRYLSEGKYEEAILAFTAAIEIDPRNVDAYACRAEAYLAIGDEEAAQRDYDTIREIDPDWVEQPEEMTESIPKSGDSAGETAAATEILEENGTHPALYVPDNRKRLISVSRSGDPRFTEEWNFSYNEAKQLISVKWDIKIIDIYGDSGREESRQGNLNYSYDEYGNLIQISGTKENYNNISQNNRGQQEVNRRFHYDYDGADAGVRGSGYSEFEYNPQGQLIAWKLPFASYTYDPEAKVATEYNENYEDGYNQFIYDFSYAPIVFLTWDDSIYVDYMPFHFGPNMPFMFFERTYQGTGGYDSSYFYDDYDFVFDADGYLIELRGFEHHTSYGYVAENWTFRYE